MPMIDARHYKTLLICPSKAMAADVGPLLAHGLPLAPIHDVNVYPNRRQIVDLFKTFEPVLCVLDMASSHREGFEVLTELHSLNPALPVVALLDGNNPDLILRCLRHGATDFLIKPFTTEQMDACVEKVARLLPASSRATALGKTIAVFPSKGSAGATTISCNLANQCKRLGAKKILLCDMDAVAGTISFILKLKSTYSFVDVLQRQTSLDADLWRQMVSTTQGIDVLLAPDTLVDPITELPSAAPVVDFVQSTYEATILDCGSVYGTWNLSMAKSADEVVLVSTTDLPSLQAAQRALVYMEQNRVDTSKVRFVVNRQMKDLGLAPERVSSVVDVEVFHVIPNEPETVQKSLMEGKPIPAGTPVGKSLAGLADKLVDVKQKEPKKGSGKSSLFGLFGR